MFIFGSTNVLIRIKREHVLYGLMRRQKKKNIYLQKGEEKIFFFVFYFFKLKRMFLVAKKK